MFLFAPLAADKAAELITGMQSTLVIGYCDYLGKFGVGKIVSQAAG